MKFKRAPVASEETQTSSYDDVEVWVFRKSLYAMPMLIFALLVGMIFLMGTIRDSVNSLETFSYLLKHITPNEKELYYVSLYLVMISILYIAGPKNKIYKKSTKRLIQGFIVSYAAVVAYDYAAAYSVLVFPFLTDKHGLHGAMVREISNVEMFMLASMACVFYSASFLMTHKTLTLREFRRRGGKITLDELQEHQKHISKYKWSKKSGGKDAKAFNVAKVAYEGMNLSSVKHRLFGQEKAEASVRKSIEAFEWEEGKPLSLLFCGASGVGKTQMAENIAQASGLTLTQFNMSEYAGGRGTHGGDIGKDKMIGLPAGYRESERGGLLTNALRKNPHGIFLLDEMEKAGAGVYDLFLNMLDKGWLDDARGKRVKCSEATFIFTTNVARDVDPDLPEAQVRDKMVRAGFRPEMMGRIFRSIVFSPLTDDVARQIARGQFNLILKKQASRFHADAPDVAFVSEDAVWDAALRSTGYDKYGVRAIQKAMKELVAELLLATKDKKASRVVLYPAKHKVPGEKVLKGGVAVPVGKVHELDLEAMRKALMSRVKGQDHAADTIIEQLAMREIGLVAKKEQPQGTFLFTGPSGTGKTELVKALADHLGRKFLFFNMGNYKNENGVEAFFGPPPGYIGSEDGGQLTGAVLDNPDAIILLDEIEKGNPMLWDAFMSVFDDGVAKDTSTGEMVSFKNTMIFMTSNLVSEDVPQDEIREYLRDTGFFRVEMINRIENIVAFKPLGDDVKRDIVGKIIGSVLDNYNRTNGTSVKVRAEWLDRFSKLADFTNGARDVQRMIQKELMRDLQAQG